MRRPEGPPSPLLERWQRLEMQVRCGLMPGNPGCVRLYLNAGLQVARRGLRPAEAVHLRMLNTLLHSAQDEALPWFWRSVCLEHVNLPLAQLKTLIGLHDPIAFQAIEAAVQRQRDRLPLRPEPTGRRA